MTDRIDIVTADGGCMGAAAADRHQDATLSSSGKGEALATELGGFRVTGSNRSNDDSKRIVGGTMERWGRVDVLVNSAGAKVSSGLGLAYAAFVTLGVFWGSNFIFVKWAAVMISPSQIVLLRVVFGFVPLLVASLATGALHWRHWKHAHHFLVMSILATAFYYFAFAKGTVLLLSSVAGMLSGAIPLFTFVTARIFLRSESINARSIEGTLLGFVGILLIAHPWNQDLSAVNPVGIFWIIAGSLSVGASFVYAKKFVSPLGLSPLSLTTYQIGIALLLLLATTNLDGIGEVFSDTRATLGLVLGLGFCGTGLAYILYYRIVDRLGAVAASGVTYIPPIVSLAIGTVLVGEPVKPLDVMAMGAILVGVAVLQSGRTSQSSSKAVSS